MAASEAAKAHTAEAINCKQKEATASADTAQADALINSFQGQKSGGISPSVASIIQAAVGKRKEPLMKPVIRYQSKLLFRRSFKPERVLRIKPARIQVIFRPARFGVKPEIKTYECESS